MIDQSDVVDLCAGPGGWSEACKALGLHELGIETDNAACATRAAARHHTIQGDISALSPSLFPCRGLIASPPCPAFSVAGAGAGTDLMPALIDAVHRRDWSARPSPDPKVWLVLEVGRWAEQMRPEWIALEQVPPVLPLWYAYAGWLRDEGYSVWTGLLQAADFGVPQTRERAILMASRVRSVHPPTPTHARVPVDSMFDHRERWVTMADALGWEGRVGFPRLDDRGDSPDGYRERDWRDTDEPSFVVTEKARSWLLNTGRDWKPGGTRDDAQTIDASEQPAPSVTGQARSWITERPATTVMCDPRIAPAGHHDNHMKDAIRITISDALILQSFRPDYPVQGNKTKQFEQVGNAIPPRLALAILTALVAP